MHQEEEAEGARIYLGKKSHMTGPFKVVHRHFKCCPATLNPWSHLVSITSAGFFSHAMSFLHTQCKDALAISVFSLKIKMSEIHKCASLLTKASFCTIALLLNVLVHQIQQQNMKGKEVFLVTSFLLPSSIYKERSIFHSCPGFQ